MNMMEKFNHLKKKLENEFKAFDEYGTNLEVVPEIENQPDSTERLNNLQKHKCSWSKSSKLEETLIHSPSPPSELRNISFYSNSPVNII